MWSMTRILGMLLLAYGGVVALIYFRQRSLLYFPSHDSLPSKLNPWTDGVRTIGFCREAARPRAIWLMTHGNGGQAEDRDYVLRRMSDQDSLYVLEYPGYGQRAGRPSRESIDRAASEAYQLLRAAHPHTPICVLGESLGSGPACVLANEKTPPDKIVLVTPFDKLAGVAAQHYPWLPVGLLLKDNWDNVAALKNYTGPVEIYGAREDLIIPISHAKALASQVRGARFFEIPGGHNEWSYKEQVQIEP